MAITRGVIPKEVKRVIAPGSLDDPLCKNCWHRIQRGQERQWNTDPRNLGLVHVECPV